jgi:hypothetical protein
MDIKIVFSEDPALVLSRARDFLASQPVLHNLILTLLRARLTQPEPGRYCMERRLNYRTEKGKSLAKAPRSQRKDSETLRNLYSSVAAMGRAVSIRDSK